MTNENCVDASDEIDVNADAGTIEYAAAVAVAIADVTFSGDHGKIPPFMRKWAEAEATLSALNLKSCNDSSWGEDDEAERDALEKQFFAELKALLKDAVKGLKTEFAGEPRGPAIRVQWEGCPSFSFGGGLVIPLG